jgi:hypothetical protein
MNTRDEKENLGNNTEAFPFSKTNLALTPMVASISKTDFAISLQTIDLKRVTPGRVHPVGRAESITAGRWIVDPSPKTRYTH